MSTRDHRADVFLDVDPSSARASIRPDRDTPFRLALSANFGGLKPLDRVLEIDAGNFDHLLSRVHPEIEIEVGGQPLKLEFSEIDDFHPDRLYDSLPVFRALRDSRRRLADPRTSREEAARLAPPPPASEAQPARAASGGDLLESLLGGPLPEPAGAASTPAPARVSPWDEAIRKIVAPHVIPGPDPRLEDLLAQLDAAIAEQMRAILHDPAFQQVESAWRSAFFLLQRLEAGVDLKILLVNSAWGADQLYRSLYDAGGDDHRYAAIVCVDPVDPAADSARLQSLAGVASRLGARLLAGTTASVALGEPTPEWQDLRRSAAAAHIGVAAPRFMLRLPYGRNGLSTDHFRFQEITASSRSSSYLWCSGAVAAAAMAGAAFERAGWDFSDAIEPEITGIASYPLHDGVETILQSAGEIWMTEEKLEALLEAGYMPLVAFRNRDSVRIGRLQTMAVSPARLF